MEINLDKEHKKKIDQLSKDQQIEDYNKFYNKENYKISLLNIDSSFRDKNPKNIFSSNVSYLPKDPIYFEEDSDTILINYPNHSLSINDRIIIQNVEGQNIVLNADMFLFQNLGYLIIKINHSINLKYKTLLNKLKVNISIVDETILSNTRFYGNIPINSIIGSFNIELPSVVLEESSTITNILNYFNCNTLTELDKIVILIKLPFDYFSSINQIYEITDFYRLTFYDINGIPINGINADYPINYSRLQGFHEVISIKDINNFYVKTNYLAISSGNGGGNKIQVMKIIKTEVGWPENNNYRIRLKKNFNNVLRIELISTEMPYIDYLVKSYGPFKNNKIYWKHLDDGNYTYSAEIPEGNYVKFIFIGL